MGLFSRKKSEKNGFDKLLEISSNSNVFPISQSETQSKWTVKETLLSNGESFIKADITAVESDDDFIYVRVVKFEDLKIRRNSARLKEQKEGVLSLISDSHKEEMRPYLDAIFEKKALPPFRLPAIEKNFTLPGGATPVWIQQDKNNRPWETPKNDEPKGFFFSNTCGSCGETYQEWMPERSMCLKCRIKK